MSLDVNTVLDDKYRLTRIIGQGGMGIVYEAVHLAIGRKLAVKCLHRRYVGDSRVVMRFQQEAKTAGTIGHDNICDVTDFGMTADGEPYLVMPLLSGMSLETLFNREIVALDRLVDIARQTLSALDAAFKADIVHRDLKPDNIFITKVGDRTDFVKLLDFGISKILNQDLVMHLTRTGDVVGTAQYMSPEQAAGATDVDQRTDLYALGVILYEGLTGRCPFEGESYNEVMFKIINDSYPMPRALNPAVPPAVERFVLKALSRDAEARYRTPLEMDAALTAAMRETTPVGTPAVQCLDETRAGNNRMFAPAVGTSPIGKPPTITPPPTQAKNRRGLYIAAAALFLVTLALSAVLMAIHRTSNAQAVVPLQSAGALDETDTTVSNPSPGSVAPKLPAPNLTMPTIRPEDTADAKATRPSDRLETAHRPPPPQAAAPIRKKKDSGPSPVAATPADPIPKESLTEDASLIKRGIKFEAEYE